MPRQRGSPMTLPLGSREAGLDGPPGFRHLWPNVQDLMGPSRSTAGIRG